MSGSISKSVGVGIAPAQLWQPPPAPLWDAPTFSAKQVNQVTYNPNLDASLDKMTLDKMKAGFLKGKMAPTPSPDEVIVCGKCGTLGPKYPEQCCLDFSIRIKKSTIQANATGQVTRAVACKVPH